MEIESDFYQYNLYFFIFRATQYMQRLAAMRMQNQAAPGMMGMPGGGAMYPAAGGFYMANPAATMQNQRAAQMMQAPASGMGAGGVGGAALMAAQGQMRGGGPVPTPRWNAGAMGAGFSNNTTFEQPNKLPKFRSNSSHLHVRWATGPVQPSCSWTSRS
jgi:hypothetical protein